MFYGEYFRQLEEKGGRICLPPQLRKELDGKVVVVGCGDHIEIWDREKWKEEKAQIKKMRKEEDNDDAGSMSVL